MLTQLQVTVEFLNKTEGHECGYSYQWPADARISGRSLGQIVS
jgi:hypothetical protein